MTLWLVGMMGSGKTSAGGLAADAFLDLQYIDFAFDYAENLLETDFDITNFEDALLFGQFQRHVCSDGVRESACLVDAG